MPYKDHEKALEAHRRSYAKNIEKQRERSRVKSAKDVVSGRSKERQRKWRAKDPEKTHLTDKQYRDGHLEMISKCNRKQALRRAGWTFETYETAYIAQEGLCDICRQPVEGSMCADHEHVTPPKPRGLLCNSCNLALGQFKDSPIIIEAAAAYLRKHGKYE
jgi:hypothetical protein